MYSETQYCFTLKTVCGGLTSGFSSSICIQTASSDVAAQPFSGSDLGKIIHIPRNPQQESNLIIYPNPVQALGPLQLNYLSYLDQTATIRIIDMSGKTIEYLEKQLHTGTNQIPLNAPGVPGMYAVKFRLKNGVVKSGKLVVN